MHSTHFFFRSQGYTQCGSVSNSPVIEPIIYPRLLDSDVNTPTCHPILYIFTFLCGIGHFIKLQPLFLGAYSKKNVSLWWRMISLPQFMHNICILRPYSLFHKILRDRPGYVITVKPHGSNCSHSCKLNGCVPQRDKIIIFFCHANEILKPVNFSGRTEKHCVVSETSIQKGTANRQSKVVEYTAHLFPFTQYYL